MAINIILRGLRECLHKPLGRRAIAAVEFALVMPFVLVLFMGTIEISTLYRTSAKLNAVASNVARMVALTASVQPTTSGTGVTSLTDICNGAVMGLAPFPAGKMTIRIASITEEAASNGTANTKSYTSQATKYDEWEADTTVNSNGSCPGPTSGSDVLLTGSGSSAPINIVMSGTNSMLNVPCDNAIIVQVSETYPGIVGVALPSAPVLTQTAYARWNTASATSELTCSSCTMVPANQTSQQICNTNNNPLAN